MTSLIWLIAVIIVAAIVYWVCLALSLPPVFALIAALLVLLFGIWHVVNHGRRGPV